MIVIAQRNEAERLQNTVGRLTCRWQHFRHANHGTNLGLEADFDEVALAHWLGQLEQSAGYRDGKEFRSRALTIVKPDCSQHSTAELHPGRALGRVRLGEMGHSRKGL